MKTSGDRQLLSPKELSRSNGGGSTYCFPIFSTTNSTIAGITYYKFHDRRNNFVWSHGSQYQDALELAKAFFKLSR